MIPVKEQEVIINYFNKDPNKKRILLVEAPPGTGKTFTAVSTAINYIRWNLQKDSRYNKKVLILTFSKNARAQIEKQLDDLVVNNDRVKEHIEVTNFHSLFQKYVWAYSKYLGLNENLTVSSPRQRKKLLDEKLAYISDYNKDDEVQYEWVEPLLEGEFYPLTPKGNIKPTVKKLVPYKEDIKNKIKEINKDGYLGFSDMGYYMKELLNKSLHLLRTIQNKYRMIILDEYQDTSDLQDEIVRKIIGENNYAIFFADSKQMIYGWRGASENRIDNLMKVYNGEISKKELNISMRFKNKKDIEDLIKLERQGIYDINSFESSENVKYIKVKVKDKNLFSRQSKNSMYASLKFKIINALPKYEKRKDKSIGILCRYNEQVNYIKKALREEFKIPSQIISNNEEEHNIACDLMEFSAKEGCNLTKDELSQDIVKYIFAIIYDDNIGAIRRSKLDEVRFTNFKNAKSPILKQIASLIDTAEKNRGIIECLKKCISVVKISELNINYDNLIFINKILSGKHITSDKIIDLFLQYQYIKAFKELKGVYILNVHQSKGREFDLVYLIDRETMDKDDNLLYVASSRVKEKLVIFDWVI